MRSTLASRHWTTRVLLALAALCLIHAGLVEAADYASCAGTSACAGQGSTASGPDGVVHCCPSGGTIRQTTNAVYCSQQQTCPTIASVAFWPSHGCAGSQTFSAVTVPGDWRTSNCAAAPGLDGVLFSLACHPEGVAGGWRISTYTGTCDDRPYPNYQESVGLVGPTAYCYNLPVGSVVVDCSGVRNQPGTSITSPPMHPETFVTSTNWVPIPGSPTAAAAVFPDSACLKGSQRMRATSASRPCMNFGGSDWWSVACAGTMPTSTWNARKWHTYDECSAGTSTPAATVSGTGLECASTPAEASGVMVDCSSANQGNYVNYVPLVDGGWSDWGACSAACGGGTQSRSCSKPAPSGNGAPCVGASEQVCNVDACSDPDPSAESSTGAGADRDPSMSTAGSGDSRPTPADATTSAATLTLSPSGSILFLAGAAVVANGMRAVL